MQDGSPRVLHAEDAAIVTANNCQEEDTETQAGKGVKEDNDGGDILWLV